jgi:hypothetical protein
VNTPVSQVRKPYVQIKKRLCSAGFDFAKEKKKSELDPLQLHFNFIRLTNLIRMKFEFDFCSETIEAARCT